jgi:glucosyl-3-phosphoglycerate synthase
VPDRGALLGLVERRDRRGRGRRRDSADATASWPPRARAKWSPSRPAARLGPVLGKGDAMWRALSVVRGDVVAYVDGDSEDFGAHFACGTRRPIVCEPGAQSCQGVLPAPFRGGRDHLPTAAGA